MHVLEISKTQFRVSDFVGWQKDGTLILSPRFQRRPVWKRDARSFFVDTVLRGLPAPVIYIRERIDLDTQKVFREVVDGQQRLRTLISFIDPEALGDDFDASRDAFTVKGVHNAEFSGMPFDELPADARLQILGYQFSTHVLPTNTEDREVLQMFARLNATGVKLNRQELRNAEWFGEFKTIIYDLALEQLDRWRAWRIVPEDQISRMAEVELSSDLAMSMIDGLNGKTQKRLDDLYEKYDEEFPRKTEFIRRFRGTMDAIDEILGGRISSTIYSSAVHFYTLFTFVYDRSFGLGSPLTRTQPKRLPRKTRKVLENASDAFRKEAVPPHVLDAVRRASADTGRRKTRLGYLNSLM